MGPSWDLVLAVVCALGASLLYAYGSALFHRATGATRLSGASPRALARFGRSVARDAGWLAAIAVEVCGFALHAVALHEGTLVLVQPLLVSTLVFALVVRRRLDGRPVVRAEVRWAALLVAGLALFLLTVSPINARPQSPDPLPAAAVAGAGAVFLVGALIAVRRAKPAQRPVFLGLSAGICSAAVAALIKSSGNVLFSRGLSAMLTDWAFWAVLVTGVAGVALTQLAFQAGPLRASLPAMQTANPLLSVVIGIAIYDEPLSHGAFLLSLAAVSLCTTLVAVAGLSRLSPSPSPSTPEASKERVALPPPGMPGEGVDLAPSVAGLQLPS